MMPKKEQVEESWRSRRGVDSSSAIDEEFQRHDNGTYCVSHALIAKVAPPDCTSPRLIKSRRIHSRNNRHESPKNKGEMKVRRLIFSKAGGTLSSLVYRVP
jgi:hypothetical protein